MPVDGVGVVMSNRPTVEQQQIARGGAEAGVPPLDADTILDNVVSLDRMLDEGSRQRLGAMPYLELSKHLKIKKVD